MKKMENAIKLWVVKVFIATLIIFLGGAELSFATDKKVDVNALIQDTQKSETSANNMTIVWWLPEEYWQSSFEQDPNMSADQVEAFMEVVRPYILVMVIDGEVGPFGGITYESKENIQRNIRIVDSKEIHYKPLGEEEISGDMKNFLSMVGPILTNAFGNMGENMHFYLFPSEDKRGNAIIAAREEGKFSVKLAEKEFKWRLPLDSLVPKKTCPKDGEKLSGSWKYCPWHGKKLR